MGELEKVFAEIVANGGKTDKGTLHSYLPVYEKLFEPFKKRNYGTIVEIGVRDGSSLLGWRNYFCREWNVIGIDNFSETGQPPEDKYLDRYTQVIKADTTAFEPFPEQIIPSADIIIDDGSHDPYSQVANFSSFKRLFDFPDQSLYIIEDIEDISYAKRIQKLFGGEVYDLREVKKRHDDILWVWKGSNL